MSTKLAYFLGIGRVKERGITLSALIIPSLFDVEYT